MMNHATIDQLRALKLPGFALELEEQAARPGTHRLSFDERLALLVQREVHLREDRKRTRLLRHAKLKYAQAAIEDLDTRPGRGIDRPTLIGLATSGWVQRGDTVLLTGPTGVGKTWLACALAHHACREGHSSLYLRVPRLGEELKALHASGGFGRWLQALARTDVLVLDDWGVSVLEPAMRALRRPTWRRCARRRKPRVRRPPRPAAVRQRRPHPQVAARPALRTRPRVAMPRAAPPRGRR